MGTSTFINFSRSVLSVGQLVQRIERSVCYRWQGSLDGYSYLRPSEDPYEGGYEADGDICPARSYQDIEHLVHGTRPFGLTYQISYVPTYFYVIFTEISASGATVTGDVETTMVYHRDDEHPFGGGWFEKWLITFVGAVGADVCAYGKRGIPEKERPGESLEEFLERRRPAIDEFLRRRVFDALDPCAILDELRNGRLPEYPNEVFHAIKYELITPFEIKKILREKPRHEGLVYKLAPGYHILSNIVYPPKGPSIPL